VRRALERCVLPAEGATQAHDGRVGSKFAEELALNVIEVEGRLAPGGLAPSVA